MSFTEEQIQKVWEKGATVSGNDPKDWRKDECGAWIGRSHHGNRDSQYGWEIHHIRPGGGDDLSNLRPLQWENNAATQDGPLNCVVSAKDTKNVRQ